MCGGITAFDSLRNSSARAGNLMDEQGIGSLGHLGVQFARQMGSYRGVGRGADKEPLAKKLSRAIASAAIPDRKGE
jgi:D-arabinose 1-dehydrogenase-like Zn-dependent alcohol dehydrogenase